MCTSAVTIMVAKLMQTTPWSVLKKQSGISKVMSGVYFLTGCVPLDPQLTQSLEDGQNFLDLFPNSTTRTAVQKVMHNILEQIQKKVK